jgi:RND superfamily putative drug exporter
MTPSIAALMGRWFWWPQRVRARPKPVPWPTPPRHADQTPVIVGARGAGDENPTGPIR